MPCLSLQLLDGIVGYPYAGLKFADDEAGERRHGAPRYFTVAKSAVKEMHRQVGDLVTGRRGIAQRGSNPAPFGHCPVGLMIPAGLWNSSVRRSPPIPM